MTEKRQTEIIERDMLVKLIDEIVDIDQKSGVRIMDVGQVFIYYRWPNTDIRAPWDKIEIEGINKIVWMQVVKVRHEFVANLHREPS